MALISKNHRLTIICVLIFAALVAGFWGYLNSSFTPVDQTTVPVHQDAQSAFERTV